MSGHGHRSAEEIARRREMMTSAPVGRLICRLALPTIVSMLVTSIYHITDAYFVGRLGTGAVGGVGVSFPLMAVIHAFGYFFGHGSGTRISRSLGANDVEDAARAASTGFFSSLIGGSLLAIVGLTLTGPLVGVLGATDSIRAEASAYSRFILLSAPAMTAQQTLNNILRFQGGAFYGMIGLMFGAAANAVLDPLFIFGFDLGVAGAAAATLASQTIALVALFVGCMRRGNIAPSMKLFSPSAALYLDMLRGGAPTLCRQALGVTTSVFINRYAGIYGGAAAIAGISVANRVLLFTSSAMIGFGHAFQPVCGFSWGAKKFSRVRDAYRFCAASSFAVLATISCAAFAFAPSLISLFAPGDAEAIEIGARSLRLLSISLPLQSVSVMSSMMFQTIGRAMRASILVLARQGVLLIPIITFLAPRYGLIGVQISNPIAKSIACAIAIPMTIAMMRELKDRERDIMKEEKEGQKKEDREAG